MLISTFPAKLADYAILPTTYTVELTDSVGTTDKVAKRGGRDIMDSFGSSDFSSSRPGKRLTDMISTMDYHSKRVAFHIRDLISPSDLLMKGKGIILLDQLLSSDRIARFLSLTLHDTFVGEFDTRKRPAPVAFDSVSPAELISKEGMKILHDTGAMADLISKGGVKPLSDQISAGDELRKGSIKPIYDDIKFKEIVTKVEFTLVRRITDRLELERGRRVYFLPEGYEYLWDKILPEDHNLKVDAAKAIHTLLSWTERRLTGLHYPGPFRETIGITDRVEKRVTISRRDEIDWAVSGEEEEGR